MPTADPLVRHLWRLRALGLAFAPVVPLAWWLTVSLSRAQLPWLPPLAVTVLAGGLGIGLAFTAERAARRRLEQARKRYAEAPDRSRLLAAHLRTYLTVLLRLAAVAALGPLVAVWGTGSLAGSGLVAVAAALMLMAWPTEAKGVLLLHHAEEARRERGRRDPADGDGSTT
jgi:hypothetical protein